MKALPCLLLLLCTSSSLAFLLAPPSASSPHVCPSFPYCFQDSRTGLWAPLSLHHLLAPTYQSSPMMHKSVAYQALTVAAPSTRESSPCWLPDTYCTARPSNTLATREVDTAALCQEECAKKEGCTYFTFTKRRGKSSCSLLSECTISARCEVGPNCASGRPTCSCPQIKKGGEEEAEEDTETRYARWSCGSVDPYTSAVPTGTVCKTTCPAWRNQGLESTCQPDGQWSNSVPTVTASSSRLAPLILPYFDFVIAKPDQPDMVCGCQDVGPFDYDPTAEEGAEMVCRDSDPPQFSSDQGWKFTTTNYCTLFCNKEPVVDVYCQGSRWQGEPERGLWCYTQPDNPAPGKISVDCGVSQWSFWGSCSRSCGKGSIRERSRDVEIQPKGKGKKCPSITESQPCQERPCPDTKCQNGGNRGVDYKGTASVTLSGKTCQAWTSNTPHQHDYRPAGYPLTSGNFCRNPDNSAQGVWCYTTDPNVRFEFCKVPFCSS